MGDFSGQVIAFARRSRAKVVIVPPREGKHGDRVTALARACECPILVLRTPPGFQTLIAATDLEHQEFPVLRVAAELAARLDARVLALHNARPVTSAQRPEATFSTAIRLRSGTGLLREARSNDAASDRVVMVDGLVSNRPDTVDVILRQSRANAPALVVVGTRARQGAVRPIFGGVAARVVDGCHSSVLVTPVQDGTHHGDQTPMATRFDEA
jgi:nucleotide-binding universal stress UspA family protein